VVGVVALHPSLAFGKSNYDMLADFSCRRPDDYLWTHDINDEETYAWLSQRKTDVLIQCGWSQIFKPEVIKIPSKYCMGIHPSPLPEGRGAAVINWKIIEGGGEWGNSLFVMEPKTDQGPILDFEPFILEARDDAYTAYLKVSRTAEKMLRRTLPRIADGSIVPTIQDHTQSTRYYNRRPEDGLMHVDWPAEKILNYVRALTAPYPGGFFVTPWGKMIVWRAKIGEDSKEKAPGTILDIEEGVGVRIQVGNSQSIWLTLVRPPSTQDCWLDEWAPEQSLHVGQTLFIPQ
jgi:methionyl-tRNA formyltransferase